MTVSEELINLCPDYDCRHLQPSRGKPWENIAEQRRKPTLNSSDIYAGVAIPSNVGVISNYCHIKTPFSFALPSTEGRAKARNLLNDRVIIRQLCG